MRPDRTRDRPSATFRGATAMLLALTVGFLAGAQFARAATVAPLSPQDRLEMVTDRGVVQALDLAGQQMVVDGVRYTVAIDAIVRIRGGDGAFSLLERGMKVEYTYRRIGPSDRLILRIDQLPDNTPLDET